MCSREEVCCGTQEVYSVTFSELRLTRRENATNYKKLDGGHMLWFLSRITFFEKTAASFLELDLTSGIASSITSGLTTYQLASCVVANPSNSKVLHQNVEDHSEEEDEVGS